MTTYALDSTAKPSLFAQFISFFVGLMVDMWDNITQTPTQFGFTPETDGRKIDRMQVDVVLYLYNPKGYGLQRVGVKLNRGADRLRNYHTRAINRIINEAARAGFTGIRYIERSTTCATLWSYQKL